ncbi:serine/threonine-protein kinase [Micromonospora sp. WMMD1128]|uniref:serine/threonine-protein kinase n=1 Tax=unclassified Micromonospora TaxID=2617518 RepID=UPI00248C0101|nr:MULTISPECIES: serine/threonine-protein kinase [unclassified Micromonospora]WBB76653.1 serine/threonine-protein kinase [Micromonospora sp. WMMD1128]WFE35559.1 serine/threonine-protein kinase [Micromonospora sp. WMMD975]
MRVLAGRYRLVEQIGRGGTAIVWRAVDELLGRTVAVKLLDSDAADDRWWRAAVRAEARAAARLNHANVAAVYDYGEARTAGLRRLPFLVLEYVEGETLADALRRDGALDWPRAVRVCAEVAAGVAAVHAAGLVHRDLKPGNVLLSPAGPKLVDLGIALAVGADTVNGRGEIRGTPAYMAPEQLLGEVAVPASDVYALGLLLTECLTGRRPVRPDEPERDDHLADLPVDGVPDAVDGLRRACLAPQAGDRPTADEVARRLGATVAAPQARMRPAVAGHPAAPPTVATGTARSRRRRALLVGSLPVALAGAVLAAQLPGLSSTGDAAEGAAELPSAAPFGCAVAWSSDRATDGTFGADVTVEVSGPRPAGEPVLSFRLPPGQRLTAPLDRWQSGRQVRLPVTVDRAGTTRLPLRGTWTDRTGTAADSFAVGGVPCRRSAIVTIGDTRSATGPSRPEAPPTTEPVRADAPPSDAMPDSEPTADPQPSGPASDEPSHSATPSPSTSPSRSATPSESATPPPPTADPTGTTEPPTTPPTGPDGEAAEPTGTTTAGDTDPDTRA